MKYNNINNNKGVNKIKEENNSGGNLFEKSSWFNNKVLFIISLVIMSFSSFISVFAVSSYLYNSNEVSFNNSSSSSINSSNVQGAIDELYADAHNYEEMSGRVAELEGHWSDEGDWLKLTAPSSSASYSRGLLIYDNNDKTRGRLMYDPGTDTTYLDAVQNTGTGVSGTLNLRGNPVKVNGVNITGPTAVSLTAKKGTLSGNRSFCIGNAVFLNFKLTGVTVSASTSTVVATIPSGYIPGGEAQIYMRTNTSNSSEVFRGWIRNSGEIAVISNVAVNNAEVYAVTSYIK